MFTIEQITSAHSKVKSGADFPNYIKDLNALGVERYEAFVLDGHVEYYGTDNYKVSGPVKYDSLNLAEIVNYDHFKSELKAHQQGKTDYPSFIRMCADCGIEKWRVDINELTCVYFDRSGNTVLEEQILLS